MQLSAGILSLLIWNQYLEVPVKLLVERALHVTVTGTAVLPLLEESVHTAASLATYAETKLSKVEESRHHKVEIVGTKGLPINTSPLRYDKY